MPMELITIITAVISANTALAGLIIRIIITGQSSLREEMQKQREEMQAHREENKAEFKAVRAEMQAESKTTLEAIGELRERMAHLEGLMEGLREALTGRRVAEDSGDYGK